MRTPAFLWRHVLTVEPLLGTGPSGPVYGAPVEVRGLLRQSIRLVRNPAGDQVTSSSTFYAPLDTVAPAKSRATLPDGRKTTVITTARQDGGGLPTPDHLEVQLL